MDRCGPMCHSKDLEAIVDEIPHVKDTPHY